MTGDGVIKFLPNYSLVFPLEPVANLFLFGFNRIWLPLEGGGVGGEVSPFRHEEIPCRKVDMICGAALFLCPRCLSVSWSFSMICLLFYIGIVVPYLYSYVHILLGIQ